jgi:hypothetical protein
MKSISSRKTRKTRKFKKSSKSRKTKLIYGGEKNGDTAKNDARNKYKSYIGNARVELESGNIQAAINNLDEYLKQYKEDTEIQSINDLLEDSQRYIEEATGKIVDIVNKMEQY